MRLFAQQPQRAQAGADLLQVSLPTGGGERIAIRLANQWVQAGRRVSILCGVASGPLRPLVDPKVSVVGTWPEIARSPLSRFMLGSALVGYVELLQPDIIFSPGNFHFQ